MDHVTFWRKYTLRICAGNRRVGQQLPVSLGALCGLGLLAAQSPMAANAQSLGVYTERTLSSGGYSSAQVNGVSFSGAVIVGTGTTTNGSTTTSAGLEWGNASTTPINLNEGGVTNSQASGTDGASIVGLSVSSTTESLVVWSGTNYSTATTINVPFPTYSNINVSGISGTVITGFAVVSGVENAYTYNYSTSSAVQLNPTSSSGAETFGISGTTVIGEATLSGASVAGVWTSLSSASFVNLGSKLNATTYSASVASGLYVGSNSDLIVGNATTSTGHNVAVTWTGSGTTFTPTVLNSGTYSSAVALATNGNYIVGYGVDANGVDHAVAWAGNNATVAPVTLAIFGLPSSTGNSTATGVDSRGDIVGTSNGQAFELTATAPEPGSAGFTLISGIGALVVRLRARRRKASNQITR